MAWVLVKTTKDRVVILSIVYNPTNAPSRPGAAWRDSTLRGVGDLRDPGEPRGGLRDQGSPGALFRTSWEVPRPAPARGGLQTLSQTPGEPRGAGARG